MDHRRRRFRAHHRRRERGVLRGMARRGELGSGRARLHPACTDRQHARRDHPRGGAEPRAGDIGRVTSGDMVVESR